MQLVLTFSMHSIQTMDTIQKMQATQTMKTDITDNSDFNWGSFAILSMFLCIELSGKVFMVVNEPKKDDEYRFCFTDKYRFCSTETIMTLKAQTRLLLN